MEVNYEVKIVAKNNVDIKESELKDIIAKKLLRIILMEEEKSIALNNS